MLNQQKIYEALAESLSKLFQPMLEIALFDQDNKLIVIYNRINNNNELPTIDPHISTKLLINKNQQAKLMIIPLESGYYLRLLVDITLFESLKSVLLHYLDEPTAINTTNWQQSVDHIIQNFLEQQQTSLNALSAKDKRSIVLLIHEQKLFRYQDATKYLANKLMVSRATIYNYLQQAKELHSVEIHQVDAFTDEPFSGNPAGVVLNADNLDESMMKKIAREMNLSETSFVSKSKKADIKLRYFTPNGSEVKFCGHSTVGALYMLAHEKMLGIEQPGDYPLRFEAAIGIISAIITLKIDNSITIQFQTPAINLINSNIAHSTIAHALGIPLEVIDNKYPVMFEKNNQDLYLKINSLKDLGDLQIDMKSAKQFAEQHQIVVFTLFTQQTFDKNNHIHMRCFAPWVGVPEDPFTGSALGGLAEYLIKNNLIDENCGSLGIEQGHFIDRPGGVTIDLTPLKKGQPPYIIAKAHHFFSTKIAL